MVAGASRFEPDTKGQMAVIFEEAHPAEIAPLIVHAYGLIKREGEMTQLVLRGSPPPRYPRIRTSRT